MGRLLLKVFIGRAKYVCESAAKSCNANLLNNPYEVNVFLNEKFQVDYDEEESSHFIQKLFFAPKDAINREFEVIGETIKGSRRFNSVRSTGHRNIVEARNVICLCNRCLSRESIPCIPAGIAQLVEQWTIM